MFPRDPYNIPWPCFAPFRDDPELTVEENIALYWTVHDRYFCRCVVYLRWRQSRGYVVPEPPDQLVQSLLRLMPPLPGREAEYREWIGVTFGRRVWAWDEARKGR